MDAERRSSASWAATSRDYVPPSRVAKMAVPSRPPGSSAEAVATARRAEFGSGGSILPVLTSSGSLNGSRGSWTTPRSPSDHITDELHQPSNEPFAPPPRRAEMASMAASRRSESARARPSEALFASESEQSQLAYMEQMYGTINLLNAEMESSRSRGTYDATESRPSTYAPKQDYGYEEDVQIPFNEFDEPPSGFIVSQTPVAPTYSPRKLRTVSPSHPQPPSAQHRVARPPVSPRPIAREQDEDLCATLGKNAELRIRSRDMERTVEKTELELELAKKQIKMAERRAENREEKLRALLKEKLNWQKELKATRAQVVEEKMRQVDLFREVEAAKRHFAAEVEAVDQELRAAQEENAQLRAHANEMKAQINFQARKMEDMARQAQDEKERFVALIEDTRHRFREWKENEAAAMETAHEQAVRNLKTEYELKMERHQDEKQKLRDKVNDLEVSIRLLQRDRTLSPLELSLRKTAILGSKESTGIIEAEQIETQSRILELENLLAHSHEYQTRQESIIKLSEATISRLMQEREVTALENLSLHPLGAELQRFRPEELSYDTQLPVFVVNPAGALRSTPPVTPPRNQLRANELPIVRSPKSRAHTPKRADLEASIASALPSSANDELQPSRPISPQSTSTEDTQPSARELGLLDELARLREELAQAQAKAELNVVNYSVKAEPVRENLSVAPTKADALDTTPIEALNGCTSDVEQKVDIGNEEEGRVDDEAQDSTLPDDPVTKVLCDSTFAPEKSTIDEGRQADSVVGNVLLADESDTTALPNLEEGALAAEVTLDGSESSTAPLTTELDKFPTAQSEDPSQACDDHSTSNQECTQDKSSEFAPDNMENSSLDSLIDNDCDGEQEVTTPGMCTSDGESCQSDIEPAASSFVSELGTDVNLDDSEEALPAGNVLQPLDLLNDETQAIDVRPEECSTSEGNALGSYDAGVAEENVADMFSPCHKLALEDACTDSVSTIVEPVGETVATSLNSMEQESSSLCSAVECDELLCADVEPPGADVTASVVKEESQAQDAILEESVDKPCALESNGAEDFLFVEAAPWNTSPHTTNDFEMVELLSPSAISQESSELEDSLGSDTMLAGEDVDVSDGEESQNHDSELLDDLEKLSPEQSTFDNEQVSQESIALPDSSSNEIASEPFESLLSVSLETEVAHTECSLAAITSEGEMISNEGVTAEVVEVLQMLVESAEIVGNRVGGETYHETCLNSTAVDVVEVAHLEVQPLSEATESSDLVAMKPLQVDSEVRDTDHEGDTAADISSPVDASTDDHVDDNVYDTETGAASMHATSVIDGDSALLLQLTKTFAEGFVNDVIENVSTKMSCEVVTSGPQPVQDDILPASAEPIEESLVDRDEQQDPLCPVEQLPVDGIAELSVNDSSPSRICDEITINEPPSTEVDQRTGSDVVPDSCHLIHETYTQCSGVDGNEMENAAEATEDTASELSSGVDTLPIAEAFMREIENSAIAGVLEHNGNDSLKDNDAVHDMETESGSSPTAIGAELLPVRPDTPTINQEETSDADEQPFEIAGVSRPNTDEAPSVPTESGTTDGVGVCSEEASLSSADNAQVQALEEASQVDDVEAAQSCCVEATTVSYDNSPTQEIVATVASSFASQAIAEVLLKWSCCNGNDGVSHDENELTNAVDCHLADVLNAEAHEGQSLSHDHIPDEAAGAACIESLPVEECCILYDTPNASDITNDSDDVSKISSLEETPSVSEDVCGVMETIVGQLESESSVVTSVVELDVCEIIETIIPDLESESRVLAVDVQLDQPIREFADSGASCEPGKVANNVSGLVTAADDPDVDLIPVDATSPCVSEKESDDAIDLVIREVVGIVENCVRHEQEEEFQQMVKLPAVAQTDEKLDTLDVLCPGMSTQDNLSNDSANSSTTPDDENVQTVIQAMIDHVESNAEGNSAVATVVSDQLPVSEFSSDISGASEISDRDVGIAPTEVESKQNSPGICSTGVHSHSRGSLNDGTVCLAMREIVDIIENAAPSRVSTAVKRPGNEQSSSAVSSEAAIPYGQFTICFRAKIPSLPDARKLEPETPKVNADLVQPAATSTSFTHDLDEVAVHSAMKDMVDSIATAEEDATTDVSGAIDEGNLSVSTVAVELPSSSNDIASLLSDMADTVAVQGDTDKVSSPTGQAQDASFAVEPEVELVLSDLLSTVERAQVKKHDRSECRCVHFAPDTKGEAADSSEAPLQSATHRLSQVRRSVLLWQPPVDSACAKEAVESSAKRRASRRRTSRRTLADLLAFPTELARFTSSDTTLLAYDARHEQGQPFSLMDHSILSINPNGRHIQLDDSDTCDSQVIGKRKTMMQELHSKNLALRQIPRFNYLPVKIKFQWSDFVVATPVRPSSSDLSADGLISKSPVEPMRLLRRKGAKLPCGSYVIVSAFIRPLEDGNENLRVQIYDAERVEEFQFDFSEDIMRKYHLEATGLEAQSLEFLGHLEFRRDEDTIIIKLPEKKVDDVVKDDVERIQSERAMVGEPRKREYAPKSAKQYMYRHKRPASSPEMVTTSPDLSRSSSLEVETSMASQAPEEDLLSVELANVQESIDPSGQDDTAVV